MERWLIDVGLLPLMESRVAKHKVVLQQGLWLARVCAMMSFTMKLFLSLQSKRKPKNSLCPLLLTLISAIGPCVDLVSTISCKTLMSFVKEAATGVMICGVGGRRCI